MVGNVQSLSAMEGDVFVQGGQKWTSFNVPPSGAVLTLNVKKGTATAIKTSTIRLLDTSDTDVWKRISDAPDLHVYQILGIHPGREWVSVVGKYNTTGGGGGGGGSDEDPSFEVGVVHVEVKSVTFTSDHQVLMNYHGNFEESGGPLYAPRGWIKGGANNPVSHTQNKKVTVDLVLCANPSGLSLEVKGVAGAGLNFPSKRFTSTGADQTISMTASDPLPNTDRIREESISWLIKPSDGPTFLADTSGPHRLYVTVGSPGSGPTYTRMDFVCSEAKTCPGTSACADAIWNAVAAKTHFNPGGGQWDDWHLLDAWRWNTFQGGDCDNQARCMASAVGMLGIQPAAVAFVCASTNAGTGNCLTQDTRICPIHGAEKLLLDFPSTYLNEYEGCCRTAGSFYAITPKKKAADDYQMLRALGAEGVTQHWCMPNPFNLYGYVECSRPGSEPPIP
jgi:hypothetical protein